MAKFCVVVFCLFAGLAVATISLAQEVEETRDASGRVVETVDEDGLRGVYIYDDQGNLQEIRYSDGRVVRTEPVPKE